jgi:transposase
MAMTSTMTRPDTAITVGVDTHKDLHVAAALDDRGAVLGTETFCATAAGYEELRSWALGFGELVSVGVEGTGSWGAGLARHLSAAGVAVIEVNRTNRQHRRRHGKSDTADAVGAARAVQSGEASATPKTGTGPVEAVRVLRVTLRSAIKARTQAINQMRSLLDVAEPQLRDELGGLNAARLAQRCARLRPGTDITDPTAATKTALRSLGRRHQALSIEIDELRPLLERAVTAAAPPALLAEHGVGTDTAAALLIAAGDNPHRMHSDAAFAALCGVAPVDASSGRQQRHRLNRGGNRDANNALWRIVLVKMATDTETRDFIAERLARGKTKREAIRSLKRHLARRYWKLLVTA